jgi:hypothetical protein
LRDLPQRDENICSYKSLYRNIHGSFVSIAKNWTLHKSLVYAYSGTLLSNELNVSTHNNMINIKIITLFERINTTAFK